jgi:hypothetical protein
VKIVTRKLDVDMHGPKDFAQLSEQELIADGYVWEYNVFNGAGYWVRTGISKIETKAELLAFLESGLSSLEWAARNAK